MIQSAWATMPFVLNKIPTTKPFVALTFYDGPSDKSTLQILEVLKKTQSTATFFLIGKQIQKHPFIAVQIGQEGHTLGNHTYGHDHFYQLSDQEITRDIAKSQLTFHQYLNHFPEYFSPPETYAKPIPERTLTYHFKHVVKWTLDSRDWQDQSDSELLQKIMTSLKPGTIIYFHEPTTSPEFLASIITFIQIKGYECRGINDIISEASTSTHFFNPMF